MPLVPDDDVIASVSLLQPRPWAQWPTVFPFAALYAAALYCLADPEGVWGPQYSEQQVYFDFAHAVAIPLIAFLHAFLSLLTVWAVGFRARALFMPAPDVRSASHLLVRTKAHRGASLVVPLVFDATHAETSFTFQQSVWRYAAADRTFRKPAYPEALPFSEYRRLSRSDGAFEGSNALAEARRYFGPNAVEVRVPDFKELMVDHMLAPFFVFQMFCVTLWLLDDYWMVALFNGLMMAMLEGTVVMQRLASMRSMRQMAEVPVITVRTLRGGAWVDLPSNQLLPRDVVVLPSNQPAPADIVVVQGTVVANEAMLTGESTPQMKEALPEGSAAHDTERLDTAAHARHLVFAGTQLLASSSPKTAEGAVGVVVRTGFETQQGQLIRTIIHSQSRVSQNSGEALGFIAVLLVFACAASWYVLRRGLADPTKSRWKLFLTCTQIITNVVPPELPMELSLAVNTSLMALMKLRVFCTEPFRIPFAGKVDTCCFDKTGTLTTDEMLFAGVDPCDGSDKPRFGSKIPAAAERCLIGCHSLVSLDDGKFAGDAMEKAAVDALGWRCVSGDGMQRRDEKAKDGRVAGPKLSILRRFPFAPALRRMSCVVSYGGEAWLVSKGAPETVAALCSTGVQRPAFERTVTQYTNRGLRVIALAARRLTAADVAQVDDLDRDVVERGLTFHGLTLFECPLKKDAADTIAQLANSAHRCVMITGDNISTAAAVARDVGMLSDAARFMPRETKGALEWLPFEEEGNAPVQAPPVNAQLLVSADSLSDEAFAAIVEGYSPQVAVWARCAPHEKEAIVADLKHRGRVVLMAGDGTNDVGGLKQAHVGIAVLNSALLLGNAPDPSEPKTEQPALEDGLPPLPPAPSQDAGFMDQMRYQMAVAKRKAELARREKILAVQQQHKDKHADQQAKAQKKAADEHGVEGASAAAAMTSMFNDMEDDPMSGGAPMVKLGDASIAAPFTCKSKNLTSICDIVRLGRCALVTTLQMYKILALNCLVSAYTMAVLFSDGVKFGQTQMVASGIVTAVCFLFMSRSQPLPVLSTERPITRVFHPYMVVSIGGQFAVHLYSLMQSVALVHDADPEGAIAQKGEDEHVDFRPTLLNSILFLMTTIMTATTFAVNYKGKPFKTSLWESKPLLIALSILGGLVLYSALEIDPDFNEQFELVKFPNDALRERFLVLLVVDVLGSVVVEKLSFLLLGRLP